jgi:hypothetical protein
VKKLRLVIPVYNDWTSFRILLEELDKAAATLPFTVFVSAVDDGSTEPADATLAGLPTPQHLAAIELLHLSVNVGHQRAIAIGLCVAVKDDDSDAVLIMDADGEDPPQALHLLTQDLHQRADFCIVAERRKRVESLTFKLCYILYKAFFKIVTGKTVNFGNFSILSIGYARRLVMLADLWNNLPAAVMRSKLPFTSVPIDRGKRYAGKSKMNFNSLIVHGLSGISVYADTIFVRLLMLSALLVVLTVAFIAIVFYLRLFVPAHATPGWATTVTFGMAIILLQVLFTALSSILMLLNNRTQRLIIPIVDFPPYLASRRLLFDRSAA